ncbi:uncharacterized protein [Fopius arisanus]|uniref:Uncharacterized protein isoform X2 n=1 Tax=Fopius arisanus TaxID=64838 RepID=A0A9R1SZ28_9HYME|nr:PREDICTED: uncharacterized protein LOC105264462 isoform X2 [Fopius arisanus]
MKKRRVSSHQYSRFVKLSSKPGENRASDSILLRNKVSQDLKRKRLPQNANQKRQFRAHQEHEYETPLTQNPYDSLKTLFDVKKTINLKSPSLQLHEADDIASDSLSSKYSDFLPPNLEAQFPDQYYQIDFNYHPTNNQVQHSALNFNSNLTSNMADEEEGLAQDNTDLQESNVKIEDSPEVTEEDNKTAEISGPPVEGNEEQVDTQEIEDNHGDVSGIKNEESDEPPSEAQQPQIGQEEEELTPLKIEARPPDHPIPPGVAEGVEILPGQRTASLVSSLPMTDSGMLAEITEARERCKLIEEEIDMLQKEFTELQQKEDLTEEDKVMASIKSDQIIAKMNELENMTRKLQRMLGLGDPTSEEFAKIFEMFPAPPHHRDEEEDGRGSTRQAALTCKDKILLEESKCKFDTSVDAEISGEDEFDIRPPEFPEDRLPRVIVCGYTEDNIPKIVVADSQKKPRFEELQRLKNITGKLTETLNMQEKLAQENAHFEGNKYKLQEALLEKDNTVDLLQRKVCGLQKEMQLLMKENEQLGQQLLYINKRMSNSPCCSSPGNSPRVVDKSRRFSPECQRPDSHSCKCCPTNRSTLPHSLSACSPRGPNSVGQKTPRLGGGSDSRKIVSIENPTMCCRNPAVSPRGVLGSPLPRGPCPAEIQDKLNTYETSTKQLEQQLGCMESEVRSMKVELANVQREREQLEQQKKLLKCTGPCAPCPCPSPQDGSPIFQSVTGVSSGYDGQMLSKTNNPGIGSSCSGICIDQPPGASSCPQQNLRDLREQYARLQEDYKNKLCEVSCLRTDFEKIKQENRKIRDTKEKAENRLVDLEERLKKFESERTKFGGSREQMIEDKHRLMVAEQRHKEALEELEELRLSNQDYMLQLEDYRNKYLKAQETVEEQSRQLDMMEIDNARMNENVTLEIGRVKNQFQEKLAELAPLPEILKQAQLKLQECQQMRVLAERNSEELDRELLGAKDKIGSLSSQLDNLRSENAMLKGENGSDRLDDLENKISELRNENERLKNAVSRFDEREADYEEKLEQKLHEIVQLSSENELVRQDAARQVARTKERCETIRRAMQDQIADMEKQLAQCRAIAKAAQKDRDEIRQKMQGQINRLSESFEQAQGRIRTLQGHVNYLKTSYSNVFNPPAPEDGLTPSLPPENMSSSPYDRCDCAP